MEPKPKNLTTKLVEVMAAIDHVEKRGYNKNQDYKFMKAADVARAVREELAKRNVLMLSSVVSASRYTIPTKNGTMGAVDLHVLYTFLDGDSDAKLEFHGYGSGADSGDKASPKAHTAALKYALRNTFLVPDESDPEADENTDTETQGVGKAAPKPIQQPQTPRKSVPAPAKGNPKPFPDGGGVVEFTVKAASAPRPTTKGGNSYGLMDDNETWWNTFEEHVGKTVKRGGTYRFVTVKNGKYTNIVGFESDFEIPAEQFAATDDDLPPSDDDQREPF